MKKLSTLILLASFSGAAFPVFITETVSVAPAEALECKFTKEKELYLIVQSTHKAEIKGDTIILHDVSPYATAFTQRPIRNVELITLNRLLGLWDVKMPDSFTKNPPNAAINALIEDSDSTEHVNFFVQLLEPKYDMVNQALTYKFKPLDGSPTPIPISANLGHVNLFIDDICLNCWFPGQTG